MIQVYDDALGREKPKTFIEFQERLKPIINEQFADLDLGSAMITRGEENIRYHNLLSEAVKIAGYPIPDPLKLEFFRDLHFWSGIPRNEMEAWKNREVLIRMVSTTFQVAKEEREKKRG